MWRGGLGAPSLFPALFVCRCLTRFTLLRFLHPAHRKPDRRISGIRLSEKTHTFAHGKLRVPFVQTNKTQRSIEMRVREHPVCTS